MSDKHMKRCSPLVMTRPRQNEAKTMPFYLIKYAKLKCLRMPRVGKIVKQQEHWYVAGKNFNSHYYLRCINLARCNNVEHVHYLLPATHC